MKEIRREELVSALIELNTSTEHDALVLTRDGEVKAGDAAAEDTLCVLMTVNELGKRLCEDGLFAYTGKELRDWAEALDIAPLQAKADAAAS